MVVDVHARVCESCVEEVFSRGVTGGGGVALCCQELKLETSFFFMYSWYVSSLVFCRDKTWHPCYCVERDL